MAAIDYMTELAKNKQRKEHLAKNYLMEKTMRLLRVREWGDKASKRMAMYAYSLEDPGAKKVEMANIVQEVGEAVIDPDKVCMLGKAMAGAAGMAGVVHSALQKLGEGVEKKIADAEKQLKKKGWRAAVGRFEPVVTDMQDLRPFPTEVDFAMDPGASPWLLTLKANMWNYGADALPLVGMPAIYAALGRKIHLAFFEISAMVNMGLVVSDLASFLETPSGDAYSKEHTAIVTIMDRECVFAPAGYIALPVYIAQKDEESSAPYGSVFVWTLFASGLGTVVEENAWRALTAFNMKFLDTVAQNKVYGPRTALMSRYIAAVDKVRTT